MINQFFSGNNGSIIDIIAITLSLISFIYVLFDSHRKGAPFLNADKATINLDLEEKEIDFADGLPDTKGAEFILDCRGFYETNKKIKSEIEIRSSVLSLILDSREENENRNYLENIEKWCRLCTVSLRNSGMDMINLQLYKVLITFSNSKTAALNPNSKHRHILHAHSQTLELNPNSEHNHILHTYIKTGESVEIDLSFIFNSDGKRLIINIDETQREEKIKKLVAIKSNILDAHVPVILDAYSKIDYFIKTTNKYNKHYYQTISYIVGEKQYSTTSKRLNKYLQKMKIFVHRQIASVWRSSN